ncbi:MAG: molybdenum cofactor biosynthesis F family protein [Eubacteriales bacterium]|nr:molybdenum cofactor biosynthesis F family protein [Eubacteriales bacterium]
MAKHLYPQFTPDEVDRILRESKPYNVGGLSANRPVFYEELAGKRLTIRYDDGLVLHYAFQDAHTLTWQKNEGDQPAQEYYEALKADDNIVFFEHIVEGSRPQEARMVVWDTDTNQVTTFFASIGNDFSTREVDRDIVFGFVDDGGEAPQARHSLTEDLVGRSFIWTYSPSFTIQHIYASKWYSCFVDFNTFYGGQLLDSPCNYVKINDHIYIYSWVETEGAGIQGFALMNLHTMHDVGCFFGINAGSRLECYTFGATGEYAGQLTNLNIPNDVTMDFPWPPARPETEKEG